ncbi:MAG TPA: hotdog fold thioesterase [Acetobacteraceae bacterium]|jgi:acyl-CoA thioesterase|nr:hotdog fold thioesterase [Acetobacteraceae bacterium]
MSAPEPDDHVPTPGAVERIGTLLRCGPFAKGMDIRLVSSGEGRAVLEMEITEPLTNNKGTCHGGALFTLADTAFGVAAHYGGPVVTVGSDLQFIRPGRPGDIVRASALQISRTRRTGLFQLSISEKAAGVIAAGLFRGQWLSTDPDA